MKSLLTVTFSIFLLSLLGVSLVRSQGVSEDKGRILALETAWNHAEQSKDVAALDQLLAPELVYIDYDGSLMSKEQFLASIKSEGLSPSQIINENQRAVVFGDCAIVTGIYREKGTSNGKPYSRRGRFTDTWVKTNNTWRCVASQSTLILH